MAWAEQTGDDAVAAPRTPSRSWGCTGAGMGVRAVPDIWCLSPAEPSPYARRGFLSSSFAPSPVYSPLSKHQEGYPVLPAAGERPLPLALDFRHEGEEPATKIPVFTASSAAKPPQRSALGCLDLSPLLAPASPPPPHSLHLYGYHRRGSALGGRADSCLALADMLGSSTKGVLVFEDDCSGGGEDPTGDPAAAAALAAAFHNFVL